MLRFALAEGLVRMAAVHAPSSSQNSGRSGRSGNSSQNGNTGIDGSYGEDAGGAASSSASHGVVLERVKDMNIQEEENCMPVLVRVLLGIVETVIAGGPTSAPTPTPAQYNPHTAHTSPTAIPAISADDTDNLTSHTAVSSKSVIDKITAGVLLLVLVKRSTSIDVGPDDAGDVCSNPDISTVTSDTNSTSTSNRERSTPRLIPPPLAHLYPLPKKEITRATELFLHLL